MKLQKIKLGPNDYSWLVLDDNHLPIKPITAFFRYLYNVDKSPNTIKSYASHLKQYWEYLNAKQINWKDINLDSLAGFVGWLRIKNQSKVVNIHEALDRKGITINSILGCISSFYHYHNRLGNTDVTITEAKNLPGNRYKSLLHHVHKNKPTQQRLIKVRQFQEPPSVITKDQYSSLIAACTNYRDKFLVALLYETGLRIGQALALRHEDIVCWDNLINVKYRRNNANEVRNKTYNSNTIHVSASLMGLYGDYISTLEQTRLNEYVFINLDNYTALRYSAVKKVFMTLSQKCGFYIRPHMLRHSHASSLIDAGWDMSKVQKRLGHASIQTTINTYTHIDNNQMKAAFKQFIANKEDV